MILIFLLLFKENISFNWSYPESSSSQRSAEKSIFCKGINLWKATKDGKHHTTLSRELFTRFGKQIFILYDNLK